jgi:hypothetical protein
MKIPSHLPPDWRAKLLEERRRDQAAARRFVRACAEGDADSLDNAAQFLDEGMDAWRLACAGIAKLSCVSALVREAFVPIWVERKMLPLKVGDRRVLASALRVLMAGGYEGPPLTVYRGTIKRERRRRIYGFSWTTDVAVAQKFAEHWTRAAASLAASRFYTDPIGPDDQGVVLQSSVPREAVLQIRKPEDYYDEGEVVIDPYRLGRINVVERLTTSLVKV